MRNGDAIVEIIARKLSRRAKRRAAGAARAYSHANKFSGALPAIQRVHLSRGACLAATSVSVANSLTEVA
jgi:hypothetical protein